MHTEKRVIESQYVTEAMFERSMCAIARSFADVDRRFIEVDTKFDPVNKRLDVQDRLLGEMLKEIKAFRAEARDDRLANVRCILDAVKRIPYTYSIWNCRMGLNSTRT